MRERTKSAGIVSGPSGVRTWTASGSIRSTVLWKWASMAPSLIRFRRSGRIQYFTLVVISSPRTTSVTSPPWRLISRAAFAAEFLAPITTTRRPL